jgi:hypothetical protein
MHTCHEERVRPGDEVEARAIERAAVLHGRHRTVREMIGAVPPLDVLDAVAEGLSNANAEARGVDTLYNTVDAKTTPRHEIDDEHSQRRVGPDERTGRIDVERVVESRHDIDTLSLFVSTQVPGLATPHRCPQRTIRPGCSHGGNTLLGKKAARRFDEPIADHRTASLGEGTLAGAQLHGYFARVKDGVFRHRG